jgi:hypothetical protein
VEACRWLKEAGFPQYAQMYDGKEKQLRNVKYGMDYWLNQLRWKDFPVIRQHYLKAFHKILSKHC